MLKHLNQGLNLTLLDLATLMIVVSDNTAANLLIDQIGGIDMVNERIASLGMTNTKLATKFTFDAPRKNVGTPEDFCCMLTQIAEQKILTPELCNFCVMIISKQQYINYIPRYLPFHPFAAEYGLPQQMTVANKVGMLPGVHNDIAIISFAEYTYVLVVFTDDCADSQFGPDNEGNIVVSKISHAIFRHFDSHTP